MYKVAMRNPKTGKAECYTADVMDEHELEMSLELFIPSGYEIISTTKNMKGEIDTTNIRTG